MHDVSIVQLLYAEQDLASYELHLFFVGKSFRAAFWWLLGLESFAQVASRHEGHHEVQSLLRAEEVVHGAQVRMITHEAHLAL